MKFTKMHGAGNDFIIINNLNYDYSISSSTAQKLCRRHFGIGADGVLVILPPGNKKNDYKMRIINSDGSEPEMCGNGIRCFTHYLQQNKMINKDKIRIETPAGIIKPEIVKDKKRYAEIKVDMGKPIFAAEQIPVKIDSKIKYVENYLLEIKNHEFEINCVSMGNPHTVIFLDDIEEVSTAEIGPIIENNTIFPEKTNVEFIKIINKREIDMKVWERGAGLTLACGTGACASAAAGIRNSYLDNEVLVHLPGGDLFIEWKNNKSNIFMTGPSRIVYNGLIEI